MLRKCVLTTAAAAMFGVAVVAHPVVPPIGTGGTADRSSGLSAIDAAAQHPPGAGTSPQRLQTTDLTVAPHEVAVPYSADRPAALPAPKAPQHR